MSYDILLAQESHIAKGMNVYLNKEEAKNGE